MKNHASLVLCSDHKKEAIDYSNCEIAFLNVHNSLRLEWLHGHPHILEHFIYQISRKPNNLLPHIQRIYYCFQENLTEQLYAALLDFFIILQNRGKSLRLRMLRGTKSRLSEQHNELLQACLDNQPALPGNSFSVLHPGCVGHAEYIKVADEPSAQDHDPLQLAHDYINYSQLAEAKQVLEQAILEQPENIALSELLLELYQSTQDFSGWQRMLNFFTQQPGNLPACWAATKDFFAKDKADAE